MELAVNPGMRMPWQTHTTSRSFARQMEDYCKRRTAELIKSERLRHGQNPRDVAYALGIDTRTYERWEAADTFPQPSNFKALSDHWQVPITDLRPDLQAEQAQLDRIEEKLDEILKRLSPPGEGETGGPQRSDDLPPPPSFDPSSPATAEPEKQPARRRRST